MSDFSMLGSDFNPNEIGEGPREEGIYAYKITAAEIGATGNRRGMRLALELVAEDDKSVLYDHILVQHPSTMAMYHARKKIGTLFVATDLMPKPERVSQLVGKRVRARLIIEPENDGYPARNRVAAYLKPDGEMDVHVDEPDEDGFEEDM